MEKIGAAPPLLARMVSMTTTTTPAAAVSSPIDLGPLGPFAEYIGLRLVEASPDKVEAVWTASEKHHQPHGIVHGGVHCGVVETLGSIGATLWFGNRGRCVGVSNTTDFLRPAAEGPLVSVASPVQRARTQQLWVVETHDAARRLISRGQVRVQNIPNPPQPAP